MRQNPDKDIQTLVTQINEGYEYWNTIKYKNLPNGISHAMLWKHVKLNRLLNQLTVWNKYGIKMSLTNKMQRLCHEFDMNFVGSWGANSLIPENNKEQYLISSLIEEAISSSQMEGASTTRKVAKDMLRKNITPKDKSQQMIFNNYQTIRFIVENKNTPMSTGLLLRIHALMAEKTLENPLDAGRFRLNDDVVVEDAITHEVVHTPPSFADIPEFIETLCAFFNNEHTTVFMHPVIRAIIIHFMIAYVHPFVDGNGRTARALFYWYMLKQGYWLTEYLSISRIIARSKKSYENAYLYAEADENDIGYFVSYNLRVLGIAFKELKAYIKRKSETIAQSSVFYKLGNINERQAHLLKIFSETPKLLVTIKELQNRFSVTHTTPKTDIDGLIDKGLIIEVPLNKVKKGYIKGERFDEIIGTRLW